MGSYNVVPDYITAMKLAQLANISPMASSQMPQDQTTPIQRYGGLSPQSQSPMISPVAPQIDNSQPPNGPNAQQIMPHIATANPIQAATISPVQNINQQPFHQQQAALAEQAPNPDDPKFHHKWWANTLNAIAGGLAGAAGHPELGMQLHNQPYTNALEAWKNKIAGISPLIKSEDEQPRLESSRNISQARLDNAAAISNAGNDIKVQGINEKSESSRQREIDRQKQLDIQNQANKDKLAEIRRSIDLKSEAAKHPTSTIEKNLAGARRAIDAEMAAHPELTRDQAIKNIETDLAPTSIYTNPVAAGLTAGARTQSELSQRSSPEGLAAQKTIDDQKTQVEEERAKKLLAAKEEAKQSILQPVLDSYNSSPMKAEYFAALPPSLKASLYTHPGFQPPKALTPQARQQLDIGRTALNHITSVEELLKDPDIQSNLGALSGRITLAKQYIGGDPFQKGTDKFVGGADPIEVDMKNTNAKEQRFLTDVSNLLNWEVKNIAGNRPAHQLFDRLQKNAPGTVKGYFSNVGALQGIRDGIVNAMDGFSGIVHPSTNPKSSDDDFFKGAKVVK